MKSLRLLGQQSHATDSPVVGDIEAELSDVGRVFGQNNVASELSRGEPEREVWNFVELEFRMNSAGGK